MHSPKITAVISFCSNDWRFLKQCIEGVSPFCERVLITICDHFFDGSEENYALLEEAFRQFPHCTFLEFAFDPLQTYRPFSPLYPEHPDWRHEWHNTGRWISYFYSSRETEYLFFLDCDEIVDSNAFAHSLKDLKDFSALRFASFSHFRQAKFEALDPEDSSLLVRKSALQPEFLWDEDERIGMFFRIAGEKKLNVCGSDGKPMVRHFSGVRTREELLKKFSTWGHHWERKWSDLVDEEFSRPFNGADFVRGYRYREIEPQFDPLEQRVPSLPNITRDEHLKNLHRFPNVIIVSKKETFKKQLEYEFAGIC
jgi:hypothetical protein